MLQSAPAVGAVGLTDALWFGVSCGPRARDFLVASVASLTTERAALAIGGAACVAGVLLAAATQRRFLAYDARDPTP